MKDLLLVVPSRGRPANIERLWTKMGQTCQGETDLVVGLDKDDPANYALDPVTGPGWMVRDNLRFVVPWINELAMKYVDRYRYIGHIGDDNVPHTLGWDVRIMEALEKTPFAFGNDLYPREPGSLSCHVFTRSEVIKRLGYFGPPQIRHMYVDVAWYAWGVATGISYLHDVIIEHLHYTAGKAPADASYHASTNLIPEDLNNWHAYSRSQLNTDIIKIDPGGKTFSPAELAEFNRRLNIPDVWPW